MSEASDGPQSTEAALAMSTARLEAMSSGKAPQGEPAGGGGDPEGAQATADAKAGAATPTAEPTVKQADFSWVGDAKLRSALEATNSPDIAKWLKDTIATQTQTSQAKSALEKEVEALRVKAQAFDTIDADDELSAAVAKAYAAKKEKPAAKPRADLTQADNATIWAEIERVAEEKAQAIAERLLNDKVISPQNRKQAVLQKAIDLYPSWKDRLTPDQFKAVWKHTVEHWGEGSFSADNVERLFEPFLTIEATKAELETHKGVKAAEAAQALKATSPAGTSGVASAPVKPVERKPDGKTETTRGRTLAAIQERYGWTESQLEEAARNRA